MNLVVYIFFILASTNLFAENGPVTNFEMPRFVSLKSNDVNLRVGPSINYPIKLKYIKTNLPVEIIDEFDVWRKIIDHENNVGWIHKSLLKGDRFILILIKNENSKNIFNRPNGSIIGKIQNNNIVSLESCIYKWCYISTNDLEGWISKNNIWGVYENELYRVSFFQPLINQYWRILDNKFLINLIHF